MSIKVALITGANRGIGKEVARQLGKLGFRVILGVRSLKKAERTLAELEEEELIAFPVELKVDELASVQQAVANILDEHQRIDVLVNNAGVYPEPGVELEKTDPQQFLQAQMVNLCGPYFVIHSVLPAMRRQGIGRIVNVSSGYGANHNMDSGTAAYKVSKLALNGMTRVLADELQGTNIKVNAVCPGWVRTDMGGPDADRSVEEAAHGIVWAATLGEKGPSGGFFRDGNEIAF